MTEQATPTTRPVPTPEEIEKGKVMAILGYLICFILPLLAARDNKYAMYHQEQIFVIIILYVIGAITSVIFIGFAVYLFAFVLWIMGLINAITGKYAPLPLVGKLGEKFNLVK
jgi:uncharacterized membrane protein